MNTNIRRSRGKDIDAACGQLAVKINQKNQLYQLTNSGKSGVHCKCPDSTNLADLFTSSFQEL
ncbi:hypothetical protein CS542_03505 [Pedobacter sp. IW39]|nr:hypothetical protein CS542_03505 [Pedobacter sp. IW39]